MSLNNKTSFEQVSFDKRVLSAISRFQPVSIGYLARVMNVPNRPSVVQKNKSFDRKYVLTNELINSSKQEKEEDVEASFNRLIEKKKIVQSVRGFPKRYSVQISYSSKNNSPKNQAFDDDRFEIQSEEYGNDPTIVKSLNEGFKEKPKMSFPKPINIR
jgi:hypothetical protein